MHSTYSVCRVCGAGFSYVRHKKPRTYCSDRCKRSQKNVARSAGLRGPAAGICGMCGQIFFYMRRSREKLYCAPACSAEAGRIAQAARRPRVKTSTCLHCAAPFEYLIAGSGSAPGSCSARCREARKVAVGASYVLANAEARRKHRRQHPEANRLAEHRRRARLRAGLCLSFTAAELRQRLSMWPGCWVCGSSERDQIDHVKPIAKGGAHILANLRPICRPCNSSKKDRWPFTVGIR